MRLLPLENQSVVLFLSSAVQFVVLVEPHVPPSSELENFDYNEPQYFSAGMDHELARINVHWLGPPGEGGQHNCHVEGLSQHLLRDSNGIRAISRAIKNILDYGADTRLQTLCSELDAHRETVVRDREAA